jgi:hypothetical protein
MATVQLLHHRMFDAATGEDGAPNSSKAKQRI